MKHHQGNYYTKNQKRRSLKKASTQDKKDTVFFSRLAINIIEPLSWTCFTCSYLFWISFFYLHSLLTSEPSQSSVGRIVQHENADLLLDKVTVLFPDRYNKTWSKLFYVSRTLFATSNVSNSSSTIIVSYPLQRPNMAVIGPSMINGDSLVEAADLLFIIACVSSYISLWLKCTSWLLTKTSATNY